MRKAKIAAAMTSATAVLAIAAAAFMNINDSAAQAQETAGICGRSATVQAKLLDAIPNVSECANVTDQHLAAITGTIDLSGSTLTSLAATDLAGLSSITNLDLSDNDIDFLPSHVFDELTALTEINLSDNALPMLSPDPFHHNAALETVTAADNALTYLQPKPLHQQPNSAERGPLGQCDSPPVGQPVLHQPSHQEDRPFGKLPAGTHHGNV